MLDLAILGLLKEQDLHGYELKRRLGEILGPIARVSFGSLYPALGRLERGGAVAVVDPSPPQHRRVRATGSFGAEPVATGELSVPTVQGARPPLVAARGKKVYSITPAGDALFEQLLTEEPPGGEDRQFIARLVFAGHLSGEERLRMLERQRRQLRDRLSGETAAGSRHGRRNGSQDAVWRGRLDSYVRSVLEHNKETVEHDLAWIEWLIDLERSGGRAAPGPARVTTGATAARRHDTALTRLAVPAVARPSISGLLAERRSGEACARTGSNPDDKHADDNRTKE